MRLASVSGVTTTLVLVRHGETDWNRERRVQGQTDVPLNETGRSQALALSAELNGRSFAAVYSSDLVRAYETATILAEPRSLVVTPVPALREKHFGSWEGLTDAEVLRRFPHALAGPWGDAETPGEVSTRVVAAVSEIVAAHTGEAVLVVTHGGPIRALLRHHELDEEAAIANCQAIALFARSGVLTRC
jgi:broad specificity phosphatase PhoE